MAQKPPSFADIDCKWRYGLRGPILAMRPVADHWRAIKTRLTDGARDRRDKPITSAGDRLNTAPVRSLLIKDAAKG
jgi:hypothetical protein